MNRLLVIDGNSIINRAFYGVKLGGDDAPELSYHSPPLRVEQLPVLFADG